jgi:hypothetical protein
MMAILETLFGVSSQIESADAGLIGSCNGRSA